MFYARERRVCCLSVPAVQLPGQKYMAFGSIDKCAVLAWDPNYSESSLVACGSIDQQQSTENGCNHSLELYSLAGGVQARGGEKVPSWYSLF